MIYSSGGGKEIDERIWGIVKADPERLHLLPFRIEKTHSGYLLFYDIRFATNLLAWRSMATRQELVQMDRRIQIAVEQIGDAGIGRDYIVLQEQHMYVDDRNGDVRFICIPLKDMSSSPLGGGIPARPAPERETPSYRPQPFGENSRPQQAEDLPAFTPSSSSEWNPAEGRDLWTPESEKWGEGWNPAGGDWENPVGEEGWNPAGGDSWNPAGGDSWNPAGGDSWNPAGGDSWNSAGGDSWNPAGEGDWNPAEGRDLWEPEGSSEPAAGPVEESGHPAEEPGSSEGETGHPAENAGDSMETSGSFVEEAAHPAEKEFPPLEEASHPAGKEFPPLEEAAHPAGKEFSPLEEAAHPAEREFSPLEEKGSPEPVSDGEMGRFGKSPSSYTDDVDDEATELLLPSQRAAIGGIPEAMITRMRTGERFTIRKPRVTFGKRERTVDFCLRNNPALSRDHCVIQYRDGNFYIQDLNSSNFTYVDGIRVMPETEMILKNNSRIQMADEQFLFTI